MNASSGPGGDARPAGGGVRPAGAGVRPAGAALRTAGESVRTRAAGATGTMLTLPGRELPVLYDAEVAVVGGTLAGVAAATALARAGRRVILLEEGYGLGTDLTSANRPWLTTRPDDLGLLAPLIPADTPPGSRIALRPAALKLHLEDELLAAGAELLYGVRVLAEHRRGDGAPAGLVLANVSGRQVVRCEAALDARSGTGAAQYADAGAGGPAGSETGTAHGGRAAGAADAVRGGVDAGRVAGLADAVHGGLDAGRAAGVADAMHAVDPRRVAGAPDAVRGGRVGGVEDVPGGSADGGRWGAAGGAGARAAVWSVEFDGVAASAEEVAGDPAAGGAVFVDGCRGPGHLYALLAVRGGRRAAVRAAGRLLRGHPAFAGARLGAVGREPLSGPYPADAAPATETAPARWTLPSRPYATTPTAALLDPLAATALGETAATVLLHRPTPPAPPAPGAAAAHGVPAEPRAASAPPRPPAEAASLSPGPAAPSDTRPGGSVTPSAPPSPGVVSRGDSSSADAAGLSPGPAASPATRPGPPATLSGPLSPAAVSRGDSPPAEAASLSPGPAAPSDTWPGGPVTPSGPPSPAAVARGDSSSAETASLPSDPAAPAKSQPGASVTPSAPPSPAEAASLPLGPVAPSGGHGGFSVPPPSAVGARVVREQDVPRPHGIWARDAVAPLRIPLLDAVDVLVVGGGTAGVSAAVAAAREGARVRLVERGAGPGGTGTYGGVHSYWFGRREGWAGALQRGTRDAHRELGMRGGVGAWNIEAKALALDDALREAGVLVHYDTWAFAALCDGDRVTGAVLAGPEGPVAAEGGVLVDATGEADLAAWSGAPCVHGAAATHTVMWSSLARFETPATTRNNFGGLADLTDVRDAHRAVLAARRRSPGMHDHGDRPVTREGRHLLSETVLTLTDQLTGRHWPDVVGLHFSNHDLKGKGEALWPQLGLIPPNLHIEVPYRALLPRGLDGLLVTGKALSATHDALPALRMQADLENLGAVTGTAAAMCVRTGTRPAALDVSALQKHLVAAGLLPEGLPERREDPPLPLPDALRELAARLPLHAYSDMGRREVFTGRIPFVDLVLDRRPGTTARLAEALAGSGGPLRLALAQILVCRGHPAGADVLHDHLARALAGDALPHRDARIREAQLPPDQSAMPDEVYLLNTLALARDPRAIALWERVAELVEVTDDTLRDGAAGVFFWIEAVCAGAERLGDPRAVPALTRLHARPALHAQQRVAVVPDDFQERRAMLELALGRALAQCGSRGGVDTLIAYLADGRAPLSAQAHARLLALYDLGAPEAPQAPGRDPVAWLRFVRDRGTPPARPLPWEHDPHRADLPPGVRVGSRARGPTPGPGGPAPGPGT